MAKFFSKIFLIIVLFDLCFTGPIAVGVATTRIISMLSRYFFGLTIFKSDHFVFSLTRVKHSKTLMGVIAYNIGSTIAVGVLVDTLIDLLEKPDHLQDFFPIKATVGNTLFIIKADDFNANYLFEKIGESTGKTDVKTICFYSN